MKDKKTVILIPSYEPDPRLSQLAEILSNMDFDVLVINDGSSDKFNDIFERTKAFAKVTGYEVNRGKGEALKFGYQVIQEEYKDAKYIITCDGDGQHSPRDVNRTYEKLAETDELVFGVRYFGKDVPFRSKFGNYVSRLIRNTLTKQYIADDQCGLRGFPIRYIEDLIALDGSRYEYEMNQLTVFQLKHYTIVQLPIEVIYENGNPTSHFKVLRDTGRIHHAIFKHAWLPIALHWTALTLMIIFSLTKYYGLPIAPVWCFIFAYWPFYFFSVGIQSLMYQTKKFPLRLLRETIYFAVKLFLGCCLIFIFDDILHLPLILVFMLAMFTSSLLANLVGPVMVGRSRRPGKLRKVQNK